MRCDAFLASNLTVLLLTFFHLVPRVRAPFTVLGDSDSASFVQHSLVATLSPSSISISKGPDGSEQTPAQSPAALLQFTLNHVDKSNSDFSPIDRVTRLQGLSDQPLVPASSYSLNLSGLPTLPTELTKHRLIWHRLVNENGSTSWELEDRLKFPDGADIWNSSMSWANVTLRHPQGVVSNVYAKKVAWADVSYLSIELLYCVSMVSYPAVFIFLLLLCSILVSICMVSAHEGAVGEGKEPDEEQEEEPDCTFGASTAATVMRLSPSARRIYLSWTLFCRTIPSCMVFGMPLLLVTLTYPFPQEVFMLLVVVSSVMVFSNGVYMVFFCPFILIEMHKAMSQRSRTMMDSTRHAEEQEVVHWVVLPNYKEDLEVLSGSIESVGQSAIARNQICLLLAMEDREPDARSKALHLKAKFAGRFREVAMTFHPKDLPNDPPGKASNMSWAFKWLVKHLEESKQDTSRAILTVADADSDFHKLYFDTLTQQFIASSPEQRNLTLWQSPIFHVKNYHRQPMILIVGTMFTAMSELAVLADPNAIRFPYSTYSLSLDLAKHVGGWDAEWIAEDWHMGIKCFFMTTGQSRVQPIMLPTVNYMPEDSNWLGTLCARWAQAKRHALGFSDMSYYFMMLPVMFCHLNSPRKGGEGNLQDFWRMFFHGLAYLLRLVNTHVVVGITTLYMIISFLLKNVMKLALQDMRHIGNLFDRSTVACGLFFGASLISIAVTTLAFQVVYSCVKERMEPPTSAWQRLFSFKPIHWVYTFAACAIFAVVYCAGLAIAIWIAAIKVLFTSSFEYEVAAKPTKENRLA